MSDLHPLPLLEHDLPAASTSFDTPELRARVFPRRAVTGHEQWFFQLKVRYAHEQEWHHSIVIHGPYASARDAGKAAVEELEML